MDLEVVVEGVSDVSVAQAIKRKIQQVCGTVARPGEWTVLVCPAEMRGQWDLGVRGPFGPRFVSFSERAGPLPDQIAEHLNTSRMWESRE
jgi:hypothetical protein